jgi:hypothetical protein
MFKNTASGFTGKLNSICPVSPIKTNAEAQEIIELVTAQFQSFPWYETTYYAGAGSQTYFELAANLTRCLRIHLRPLTDAYELVVETIEKHTDHKTGHVDPKAGNYTGIVIYTKDEPITATKSHFRLKSVIQVQKLDQELAKLQTTMATPVSLLKREGTIKRAFDPFEL